MSIPRAGRTDPTRPATRSALALRRRDERGLCSGSCSSREHARRNSAATTRGSASDPHQTRREAPARHCPSRTRVRPPELLSTRTCVALARCEGFPMTGRAAGAPSPSGAGRALDHDAAPAAERAIPGAGFVPESKAASGAPDFEPRTPIRRRAPWARPRHEERAAAADPEPRAGGRGFLRHFPRSCTQALTGPRSEPSLTRDGTGSQLPAASSCRACRAAGVAADLPAAVPQPRRRTFTGRVVGRRPLHGNRHLVPSSPRRDASRPRLSGVRRRSSRLGGSDAPTGAAGRRSRRPRRELADRARRVVGGMQQRGPGPAPPSRRLKLRTS